MNRYICFYRGKQKEIYADTSLEAQKKAAIKFNARQPWEVTVRLAEKGKQYA